MYTEVIYIFMSKYQWRIRMATIGKIATLSKSGGSALYESKYHAILVKGMSDVVFEVRRASAEQIRPLVEIFGDEWAEVQD